MADNNIDTTFVLRIQSDNVQHDLSNTLKHWDESKMYDNKQINAIESTNKESYHQPTSIPSPFARIALVKTAFEEVAARGENALTAYKKIVSDSLDVAEIFFTYNKWRSKIDIIKWNYGREKDSNNLTADSDLRKLEGGHRQFYKTLKTFLENDAIEYNFDKMKSIYILKHKETSTMIGATSPCTLFFSSANKIVDDVGEFFKMDEDGVKETCGIIQLSNDHKAFTEIFPLSKRSWDFQKYLFSWKAVNKDNRIIDGKARSLFHEFYEYLEMQKKIIGRNTDIDLLENITTEKLNESYEILRSPDVEIVGKAVHQRKEIEQHVGEVNDTNSRYSLIDAYLSEDDIFEKKIIRIPYETRKDSFFNGNLPPNNKHTFLLPIKDKFFKHYSTDDLKKIIKIGQSGDVVHVELTIGNANFKREYKKSDLNLIDAYFDCAIFPNVKFGIDSLAFYRFGLVCEFKDKEMFNVEFFRRNSAIKATKRNSVRNESLGKFFQLKNYSLERANFDYIQIDYNGTKGIIIPNLDSRIGNEEYTFAVDFGTTNTHIEYKTGNLAEIKTFDISKKQDINEKQVHLLHGGEHILTRVFDEEYIPEYTDEEFKFPMRSALSFGQKTDWNNVYPFEKASLNELYEKRIDYPYNTTITNLKWSDDNDYQNQVAVYIKSLMYIIRNKVIIGNGSLEQTKIRWFYPVSMEQTRYINLRTAWTTAYQSYFGGDENNILPITESVAPFKYYIGDRDATNLVTIDIGGGTTDIVISVTGHVDYITSFRFAGNAIFGDGYSETGRVKNGIILQFFDQIKGDLLLSTIDETDQLFQIFDDMFKNKSSDDIASFLFSLKNNKRVKEAGTELAENANLGKKLINDKANKITFIFFYAAIIYHLAKLMKSLTSDQKTMPDKIVFSGNGSRIIPFVTNNETTLKGFTKLIFEKVYGIKNSSNDIEIIINRKNPKEATCKGGFYINVPETYEEIIKKKVVLHSNGTDNIIKHPCDDLDNPIINDYYNAIDKNYLNKTLEESIKFIDLVFQLLPYFANQGYKLNNESITIAKDVCYKKLNVYLDNGWRMKKKDIQGADIIDETFFFYPLIGMLKDLSTAIYKQVSKKP